MKKSLILPLCAAACVSAHATEESIGPFFSLAPVYWKADGQGLEFAVAENSVKQLDFEWEFGFEVGLGYRFGHDRWSLSLGLKHIHPTAEASAIGALFPVWMIPQGLSPFTIEKAHGHWRLHLGLLDLLLEKQILIGTALTLTPQLGLRSAIIRQKYNLEYAGGTLPAEQTVRMKNKFWGIGPAWGVKSAWHVSSQFSFFADLLSSILYGEFYLHQDEDIPHAKRKVLGMHGIFNQSAWTLDMCAGIRWEHAYEKSLKRLSFELAWDQIVLFNQNQLLRWTDPQSLGDVASNQGDLALKGIHLGASFQF